MNILVLIPATEEHKKLFAEKAPDACFTYSTSETVNESQVRESDVIIGNPPVTMLKDSKRLKWLQLQTAGFDQYTREGVLPEGVILTNTTGAYGLAISEYMLGVLLELFKKLHLYRDNQSESYWHYEGQAKSVYNSTALIIGAGDIGGELAKRIKALGGYTIGIKRRVAIKPEYLDELYQMDQLEALLPRADIVALSLPDNKFTHGVINRKTLGLMKREAILINVGRGSAVDTDALCDALEYGQLSGAALDVTDPEPLPKEHRLWGLKNAIITPHISGGFSLEETYNRIMEICTGNLEAFVNGKSLRNVVDCRREIDG